MTSGVDLSNPLGLWYGTAEVGDEPGKDTEATGELGQEQFLKLLVAQLQNQDPMSPVKNEEYVAQLATFSSLEQLIAIKQAVHQLVEFETVVQDSTEDGNQSTNEA